MVALATSRAVVHCVEPGVDFCAAVSNFGKVFFNLHCSSSLTCMNVYMTIDSGGYLCTNSLCVLIASWLDASPRSLDDVWLNGSTKE